MRHVITYAVAFVLALASVLLYVYVLTHERRLADLPMEGFSADVAAAAKPSSEPLPALAVRTFYAYGEKLPKGYKCVSAGGMVYRTIKTHGNLVIDPLIRDGMIVRCGGDERSFSISRRVPFAGSVRGR